MRSSRTGPSSTSVSAPNSPSNPYGNATQTKARSASSPGGAVTLQSLDLPRSSPSPESSKEHIVYCEHGRLADGCEDCALIAGIERGYRPNPIPAPKPAQ